MVMMMLVVVVVVVVMMMMIIVIKASMDRDRGWLGKEELGGWSAQ